MAGSVGEIGNTRTNYQVLRQVQTMTLKAATTVDGGPVIQMMESATRAAEQLGQEIDVIV